MRLSIELNTEGAVKSGRFAADPATPNLAFLAEPSALQSFFVTVDRIVADNPVDGSRLVALAAKARSTGLTPAETEELLVLQGQALRQGRAVGAVLGLFLKLKAYPMLEEVRTERTALSARLWSGSRC